MVEVKASYEGSLRCIATHSPSEASVETDAPVDNHGKGERFSPTDLIATALGTCMLTTMGIFAERHEVDLTGSVVRVLKEMSADAPRRISRLTTELKVSLPPDHPQRSALEKAAEGCPVHRSLHPEIEKPLLIEWIG